MPKKSAQHPRAILVWLLANLVLGYAAAFPLLSAVVLSHYVRAKLWGAVSAPYHGAEAQTGAAFTLVGCAVVLTVALLVNRALGRRLELRGWSSAGFWLVTLAILLTPFLYFWLRELTVPEMLGKNFLW